MKKILEKCYLEELTQHDLDEIRNEMALCSKIDMKCKDLIDKSNKLFDMVDKYINGVKYTK